MKIRKHAAILLAWLPFAAAAQTPACSCPDVLEQTVDKVTRIYAGYFDKVNDRTRPRYERLLDSLRRQAPRAKQPAACNALLQTYQNFFRDRHVKVYFTQRADRSQVRRLPITETRLKANLQNPAYRADLAEGIWTTGDGNNRFLITKDPKKPGTLVAVWLSGNYRNWQPGTVMAELKTNEEVVYNVTVFNDDASSYQLPLRLTENGLVFKGFSWKREYPQAFTAAQRQQLKERAPVRLRPVNDDFVYLRLSAFNQSEVDELDGLIKANADLINRTPNLILDLRGNGGGDASPSFTMMELLYDQPMPIPTDSYRASAEMMAQAQTYDTVLANRLKTNPGGLVPYSPFPLLTLDKISISPKRVAILMDKGCASSTEFLLYLTRYSRKTTLFGTNSMGVMDYGQQKDFRLNCPDFTLSIPVTRSGWVDTEPIDNVGFKPHVRIPAGTKDWVPFVVNHWKTKPVPTAQR
ncbi:S41 family peptidase [Tellurirhabdus rosea]|uniref:S41 family peptidase n=1 Tax=Tellurirhabdus rosea TaxID=2674997 RepID=UPI00224E9D0A|nr:S41 family peptidase [Tellurirhabdus rosea]